jgi:hypothetical protein
VLSAGGRVVNILYSRDLAHHPGHARRVIFKEEIVGSIKRRLFKIFTAMCMFACATTLSPAGQDEQNPKVKAHPHDLASSYIRIPIPPGEEAYGRLRGDPMMADIKEIVALSLKDRDAGTLLWGRVAGTKIDEEAEDWVENRFKKIGLQDVHKQSFDLSPQWMPTAWSLSATGSGKTLNFKTVRASGKALPANGMDLEPVWVGLGTESDFAGRDVKGKLAVIYSWPAPGVHSNSAQWFHAVERAAAKGAAAAVVNIAIPGDVQLQVSPSPHSAEGLPTFTMGTDDTAALRELMEKGPVKVHAQYTFDMRSGLHDSSVWGTLPGTSDEDIIIMAHHDAVFEGAEDNASGMAVMVALADYFSRIPKEQRRRTIKFVSTAGHHNGSLGTQWMHDNRDSFLAKTALMINCEHVSSTQMYLFPHTYAFPPVLRKSDSIDARRWWVNGSDKLASLLLNDFRIFGVTIYDEMEPIASGDMQHAQLDAPSVQIIESPMYYHTDYDRPDLVPIPGVEAVARAYAKLVDDVNKIDRRELLP